jgi:protein involved in polysaccharide export with SLBB domain
MLLLTLAEVLGAQVPQPPPVSEARLNVRRAQATRAELQASLAQIDTILNSPGYSSRLRETKRREAQMIRERLAEGDLQVGDQITLVVLGEPALSDSFLVSPGRVLVLPGMPEIPLRGVLRSELQDHLAKELGRYLRDPQLRVQAKIRVGILGAVSRQGFYSVPADVMLSDVLMLAGGLASAADPNRTTVRRAGQVYLTQEQVRQALMQGATLDQLNLRAGDEIVVDPRVARSGSTVTWLSLASLATTVLFFVFR